MQTHDLREAEGKRDVWCLVKHTRGFQNKSLRWRVFGISFLPGGHLPTNHSPATLLEKCHHLF